MVVHGILLFIFCVEQWMVAKPVKRKPVVVNTVRMAEAPVVVEEPKITKVAASSTKKTTVAPKKQVPAKPSTSALQEIEQSLAAIAKPTAAAPKTAIEIPTVEFAEIEDSPIDRISSYLQEMLQLPEFGEVKVELSINRFGKLEKLEVLEAKSEKNEEFLRNQLPGLHYPCFNKAVTLTIVFSNA